MSTQDAEGREDGTERCVVCEKSVAGGKGYAHVKHGGEMVALCCPLCLEHFRKQPTLYLIRRDSQKLNRTKKPAPPSQGN